MLFPTPQFAIFFFLAFVLAWWLRAWNEPRKLLLLVASYIFYGWWDWRFLALLAGSSAFNYGFGLLISGSGSDVTKKRLVALAVAVNLVVLGIFKYYNFFIDSLTSALLAFDVRRDMPFLEIILPIGISFFTFQGISYVVDVYRRHIQPVRSPLDLFLYISFFSQLVAGPIVRASHFLPQLRKPAELTRVSVTYGFLLILVGMLKKVVIAHYIAVGLVDPAFGAPSDTSSLDLLAAHYAYAIQVYCDFSAYSDIAIGTAALLGFRFRKNFDRPFSATSLQQLWQRWHISLSTWLRDYLYRALRGRKRDSGLRMYRNMFLTMLLGGLWHGAAWTFVIWGALHGAALVFERFVKGHYHAWRQARAERIGHGVAPIGAAGPVLAATAGWFITFHVFTVAAIFFRSPGMDTATRYFNKMLSFSGGVELFTPFLLLLTAGSVAVQFLPGNVLERTAEAMRDWPGLALGAVLGTGLLLIEFVGPQGVAPFIYFQF